LPAAVAVAMLTDGPDRTRSWTIGRSASPGSSHSSGAAIAMPRTPSPTMDPPCDDTSSSEQRRPLRARVAAVHARRRRLSNEW